MAEPRAEGIRLLHCGKMSQVQIAQHLGVSEATISKWKKILEESGPDALQAWKASGRPPKLSTVQKDQLVEKLKQGALAAGFPTEQWTQARVKKVIEQEFGV
jgi:putative transposase